MTSKETRAIDYREIDVEDVEVLSCEQLQEGTVNDSPNHVFQVKLPNGKTGWVAGPDGVDTCAISGWLRWIGKPADTREEAIEQGCENI